MITGGNVTIFVANMDASLKFYNEVLGLNISSHYGDHWASVEAGPFTIGLHPKSEKYPAPGTRGSMMIDWVSTNLLLKLRRDGSHLA